MESKDLSFRTGRYFVMVRFSICYDDLIFSSVVGKINI
jgi:hypothetical protein